MFTHTHTHTHTHQKLSKNYYLSKSDGKRKKLSGITVTVTHCTHKLY